MSKELKKKEENPLAGLTNNAWGAGETIISSDITVPSIKVGQGTSDAVKAGEVKYGEIYDSMTNEILAEKGKPIELIFFKEAKCIFVTSGEKANKFERIEDYTGEEYPYEETLNGIKYQRNLSQTFYCLLCKDMNAEAFPYVLNLMKANRPTAKKLSTIFTKLRTLGKPSAGVVFELSSKAQSSDNGEFMVFDIRQKREATPEEISKAKFWYDAFKVKQMKVDLGVDTSKEDATTGKKASLDDIQF